MEDKKINAKLNEIMQEVLVECYAQTFFPENKLVEKLEEAGILALDEFDKSAISAAYLELKEIIRQVIKKHYKEITFPIHQSNSDLPCAQGGTVKSLPGINKDGLPFILK